MSFHPHGNIVPRGALSCPIASLLEGGWLFAIRIFVIPMKIGIQKEPLSLYESQQLVSGFRRNDV
jgi:hypothetical protein